MCYFDLQINQRIEFGEFPLERLYQCSTAPLSFYNFEELSKSVLSDFISAPSIFSKLFMDYKQNVDIIQSLNKSTAYNSEINIYVNAKCSPDYLSESIYNEVLNIIPVVTPLDNILWYGIHLYYQENMLNPNLTEYNTLNMMYTCIYLLIKAQEAEIETEYTIDVDKITLSTNLIHLLLNNFRENDANTCLRKLNKGEVNKLKQLKVQRDTLALRIQDEFNNGKDIAQNTEKEWRLFLEIIHDLSKNELQVVKKINQTSSPKDKLKKICEYNVKINRIEKGKYMLNGEAINLVSLLDKVHQRFVHAKAFTQVYGKDKPHFRLNPTTLSLLITPKNTINYLYISFHQLRLEPSDENAFNFSLLALNCLKKNLKINTNSIETLDDIIFNFYYTVDSYIKMNSEIFDKISFKKLQGNASVVTSEIADSILLTNQIKDFLSGLVESETNSPAYKKALIDLDSEAISTIDKNKTLAQLSELKSEIDTFTEKNHAIRLILSLNIIYIFCGAIDIMLNDDCIIIKDVNKVKQYKYKLLEIDNLIIHKVYAHLDEKEMGMLEYREKYGLNTSNLSYKERQIEDYRNSLVSGIFHDKVEQLLFGIDKKTSEQILKIKAEIREEIMQLPDCNEKIFHADWLDEISNQICTALVNDCKRQNDDFQLLKEKLLSSLGNTSKKLPSSAIDSLATAEMLYKKYANDDFASKGFDFSCISALYYQAFEDSYNALIWEGYANFLNKLIINGTKYTDILSQHKSNKNQRIIDSNARGYLPDDEKFKRDFYIIYKSKKAPNTIVNNKCMYKSFATIMEEINRKSKLKGFCKYFSDLAGYSNIDEMFSDTIFMNNCKEFADGIFDSADNRNNASHGGTYISISQCKDDKKTVLNNLEEVRNQNVGLIQKLLFILKNSK